MVEFSDYIVFADESGTPVLDNPDPTFPVFVLNCLLIEKSVYRQEVVPSLQGLKFDFVGHDQLILHERDIRRQQNAFAFLQVSTEAREAFIGRINDVVANADVTLVAAVIDKVRLAQRYSNPWSPYHLALHFCLETLLARLLDLGQRQRVVHVVFESRGRQEDRRLEDHFRRITANQAHWGSRTMDFTQIAWEPLFTSKASNCTGLQLADLMARPIGLKALRPLQPNRAFSILQSKLRHGEMKIFP